MSFRNTFITEFIYQASDEVKDANTLLTAVFKKYTDTLVNGMSETGYGYFAGTIKTGDGSVESLNLGPFFRDLRIATKVPFRIVIFVESGPVIIEDITP